MTNLLETWLAAMTADGTTVAQAVRDLNAAMGTAYTPQDFYKWRRGDRPIPQPVQNHMRPLVLIKVLDAAGVNVFGLGTRKLADLDAMLEPPRRRVG